MTHPTFLCPCGSTKPYAKCCEPFHSGHELPATAEALMRSRYSAYCQGHYLYLKQTYSPSLQSEHSIESLREFGEAVHFIGLTIKDSAQPFNKVHFVAKFLLQNKVELLEEVSTFEHIEGRWYYKEGVLSEHPVQTIGRNDPCPCGSGLKFKKCLH